MSLSIHIILTVISLAGLIGFLYLAHKRKQRFEISVDQGEKINNIEAIELVRKESGMMYEPIVGTAITKMSAFWDALDQMVIISGPAENISLPLLMHEIGHGRVYVDRIAAGKKFMAINISKNKLLMKLATMSFYEYFTEKEAWVAGHYGVRSDIPSLALQHYAARALVSIADTALMITGLSLLIRIII